MIKVAYKMMMMMKIQATRYGFSLNEHTRGLSENVGEILARMRMSDTRKQTEKVNTSGLQECCE